MPATINGIGTHYYGKRDAASRAGVCPHCGADSKLESYTTRLWFVIFFIPIIPLKRVRLLDYCSRCSRHWAVNPDQYEKTRQETITTLLKSYSDQPTIESAFEVHAQMLMFHMNSEANTFREAALATFADNTDLRLGFASHLEQFGQTNDATPLYEQAFELDSSLPAARMALAARRIDQRELDSAYQLLDFLLKPGSSQKYNLNLLEVLARSARFCSKKFRLRASISRFASLWQNRSRRFSGHRQFCPIVAFPFAIFLIRKVQRVRHDSGGLSLERLHYC